MRQVPQYLIIGNGRVAHHFQYYFQLLEIHFQVWHRQRCLAKLSQLLTDSTHILILITDHAIDAFIQQHLHCSQSVKLHFSGSLVSAHAFGAHPLMTFNLQLYDLEIYKRIPFVIDDNAPDFNKLFPSLPNPHHRIPRTQKAKYHAMCVLSGNFSCMLWQKFMRTLEQELNIPASTANCYLQQLTNNLMQDWQSALTGPLVRNDSLTLQKNLEALREDPFREIYALFVHCYQTMGDNTNETT